MRSSGKRPTSAGAQYLIMIVDDYPRVERPYFLKQSFDLPVISTAFLADVNAQGVPLTVECILSNNGTAFVK